MEHINAPCHSHFYTPQPTASTLLSYPLTSLYSGLQSQTGPPHGLNGEAVLWLPASPSPKPPVTIKKDKINPHKLFWLQMTWKHKHSPGFFFTRKLGVYTEMKLEPETTAMNQHLREKARKQLQQWLWLWSRPTSRLSQMLTLVQVRRFLPLQGVCILHMLWQQKHQIIVRSPLQEFLQTRFR